MPLLKGSQNIRRNVQELMTAPIVSASRKKAIATLAKKHNITPEAARFRQALAISRNQARKK